MAGRDRRHGNCREAEMKAEMIVDTGIEVQELLTGGDITNTAIINSKTLRTVC